MILSLDHVPWSVVVSHGTTVGGAGRSWSVPVFMLNGHFLDAFPVDEDPIPVDGNRHQEDGSILHGNSDIAHGWQHYHSSLF